MGAAASDIDWLLTAADSAEDRQTLASLLESHSFGDGASLFRQNDTANGAWLIEKGAVKLIRRLPGGAEALLAQLGPGDVFGEVSLITNGGMRTSSARSIGSTQLSLLPLRQVRALAEQDSHIAIRILRRLGSLVATRAAQTLLSVAAGDAPAPVNTADGIRPEFSVADFIARMPVGEQLGYSGTDRMLELGTIVQAAEGAALDDAVYLVVRGAARALAGGRQVDICGPGRWLGTLAMASRVKPPLAYRALGTATLIRIALPAFEACWSASDHYARLLVDCVNKDHAHVMRATNMTAGRASLML